MTRWPPQRWGAADAFPDVPRVEADGPGPLLRAACPRPRPRGAPPAQSCAVGELSDLSGLSLTELQEISTLKGLWQGDIGWNVVKPEAWEELIEKNSAPKRITVMTPAPSAWAIVLLMFTIYTFGVLMRCLDMKRLMDDGTQLRSQQSAMDFDETGEKVGFYDILGVVRLIDVKPKWGNRAGSNMIQGFKYRQNTLPLRISRHFLWPKKPGSWGSPAICQSLGERMLAGEPSVYKRKCMKNHEN